MYIMSKKPPVYHLQRCDDADYAYLLAMASQKSIISEFLFPFSCTCWSTEYR